METKEERRPWTRHLQMLLAARAKHIFHALVQRCVCREVCGSENRWRHWQSGITWLLFSSGCSTNEWLMLWFLFSKCVQMQKQKESLQQKTFYTSFFFYSSQYTLVKMKQTGYKTRNHKKKTDKFQNDKKEYMKMKKTAYAWYPKFLDWTWIKRGYIACHEYASKMRKLWERSLIIIIIISYYYIIAADTSPSTCTYTMGPLDDGSLTPINKRFSMVFWNAEILSFVEIKRSKQKLSVWGKL